MRAVLRRRAIKLLGIAWVVLTWASLLASPAFAGLGVAPAATTAPEDSFDDPKLVREMSAPRVSVGGALQVGHALGAPTPPAMVASATMTRVASPRTAVAISPAAPSPSAPRPERAPIRTPTPIVPPPARIAVVPVRLAIADASAADTSASVDIAQTHKPSTDAPPAVVETSSGAWPYAPRMKLGYRRFPFTRVATAAPSIVQGALDPNRPEAFESLSLDLYPMSWYLRMGLSSQFGWESGQFDRSGDYFFAESVSFGFQLPGRFTPFVEALAGAGYMRRVQAETTIPGGYYQLGIDAGVEIYFAARAYVSVAGGYLRPGNLFVMDQNLQSVKMDTWSLKVGLGI